jgi:hypothetical protein
MTHKQLSASVEDDAPIKLPPLETQSRLADCLQDFTVLLWEHATVNMRKRGDETLTPHDMKTAYRHLLASKETSKPKAIVCDIAFALGGGLFGFGLAQFQPGSNIMLPAVILISGLALLMFSAIVKHNV